jgi:hypothetical protein
MDLSPGTRILPESGALGRADINCADNGGDDGSAMGGRPRKAGLAVAAAASSAHMPKPSARRR